MVLRRTTSDNTDEQTPVAQDCKIWKDDLFILFSYIDDITSYQYLPCILYVYFKDAPPPSSSCHQESFIFRSFLANRSFPLLVGGEGPNV